MLALAIIVPEFGNIFTSDDTAWAWYLATGELAKALLCAFLGFMVPSGRVYAHGAAIWFITQAVDEFTGTNLFPDHQWEYPILAAYCALLWIINERLK